MVCALTEASADKFNLHWLRRGYEAPKTMAASMGTNQMNQVIRHPHTTFGAVVVNVKKRFVSADARAFIPNYLLSVDVLNSKRTLKG